MTAQVLALARFTTSFIYWSHFKEIMDFGLSWNPFSPAKKRNNQLNCLLYLGSCSLFHPLPCILVLVSL